MIENRHTVLTSCEPPGTGGAEARWVGRDWSAEQVEIGARRILLVEDEEILRECLRMMLQMEGHQVTVAGNGAEALNLFAIGEFDLVITDFEMPVVRGDQLALGLKLLVPSLPILMITGSERARRDATNPVDALLNKPFSAAELHRALGRLFSARPEPAQPRFVSIVKHPAATFAPEAEIAARL